jgi:hypothetical protein
MKIKSSNLQGGITTFHVDFRDIEIAMLVLKTPHGVFNVSGPQMSMKGFWIKFTTVHITGAHCPFL